MQSSVKIASLIRNEPDENVIEEKKEIQVNGATIKLVDATSNGDEIYEPLDDLTVGQQVGEVKATKKSYAHRFFIMYFYSCVAMAVSRFF